MKAFRMLSLMCSAFFLYFTSHAAQEQWPITLSGNDGTVIKIYEPQPESFEGNTLKYRSAISVLEQGKSDPVFGTFWSVAKVETDKDNRTINIQSVKVPNIKFPGEEDKDMISDLKGTLEAQIPDAVNNISLDQVLASLDLNQDQKKLSKDLSTAAPKIFFSSQPSILVLIDGTPKLEQNKDWNLDVVTNSPFTIVKNNDGKFYMYGGKHWYTAPAATGPYSYTENIPRNLDQVEDAVNNAKNNNAGYVDSTEAARDNVVSDIVVSTSPAEMIQTDGQPKFADIDGTSLSYVSNSQNDIFQDKSSNDYYVLISGRWYKSSSLRGSQWQYVSSNSLPSDFAKIPEGSPKDNVLASVAGTDAAREAVMDAQIPQTAKVDRKTATTSVTYNGAPQFKEIPGTEMEYGTNTSSSVMLYHGIYYVVDNGVWFQSNSANGPWEVATERPDEVDRIPPSSPLYNTKYVYVYDVTPDYIYMGYTPGYLNTYIYGPTVVYGTGFYYDPWYDGFYYPRPWTWGFNMGYNPWVGWSIGYNYSYGWFNWGIGFGRYYPSWGGWWGPRIYRPPYAWAPYRSYGYYGGNFYRNNISYNNRYYNGNIYRNRTGVVTRNTTIINNNTTIINRGGRVNNSGTGRFNNNNFSQRPNGAANNPDGRFNNQPGSAQRPGATNRTSNVFSDRQGNVYQRSQNQQWQQRQSNQQWSPVQRNDNRIDNLNRQQQLRTRGDVRTQNFERIRSTPPSGGGGFSRPTQPSGGGSVSRPSGGGGSRASGSGGGSLRRR
ncbi:MAG: hypothetical protein QM764_17955 [Chitinophagaceae bacterium]